MRLSSVFSKTSKESSGDAVSANADLLTRAGFIHKEMAGVYSYLPLGMRVLQKIEAIVREEMDTIGAEVFMSALCPRENWQQTGRLDTVDVLFQASGANDKARKLNDAAYVLCGTHEEIITPLVQSFVSSYHDLPCAAYQIQTKFRNEARPKSGILRGREFRMKDLYSFHASEDDMTRYFQEEALPVYVRVFERLGIGKLTHQVLASGGSFSKQPSVEFQTECDTGEDLIFRVPGTDTCYNREIAPCTAPAWDNSSEADKPREDVVGKGIIGVEELAKFLKIEVERTTKTILFEDQDGSVIAAAIRGDYDINEEKLLAVTGATSLQLASIDTVKKVTGADVGYAGPIGLPAEVKVYWDDSTRGRKNFECGANVTNEHSINCNFGRDVDEPTEFYDFKIAKEGDLHPDSGKPYETFKAAEVGNLFTLYTKFSDAFGFTYKDSDGTDKPVYMGCYGLGTTRVLGVIAETCHDDKGLIWPAAIAPAKVHIIPIAKSTDDDSYKKAVELYDDCRKNGIDCLLDDRFRDGVGSKLADSELIGCPLRVIISPKTLDQQSAEVTERASGTTEMIAIDQLLQKIAA